MTIRTLSIITISLIVVCCSDRISDARLSAVEELASASPKEALDSLEAIDYALLSDADKHYYDFLSVKVPDKAYIMHTSDSLILKVIDYESRNQGNGRYPEALYYGGRVYSDLGDYPTALRFFQNSLEKIPSGESQNNLRGNVLSQTGRLLNEIRLYNEATPYLEEVIRLDKSMHDTINLVYDLQLLGAIKLHSGDYISAQNHFTQALNNSRNIHSSHRARSRMYLAAIRYYSGEVNDALNLIRQSVDSISSLSRNVALAYASEIYLTAGLTDTAQLYARELLNSSDPTNRKIGFKVLLSPQLIHLIPSDSLLYYTTAYKAFIEDYLNQNEATQALIQQSLYNYNIHKKKREKTEKLNQTLIYSIIAIVLLLMATIIIALYIKNRNNKTIIQLHIALDKINTLKQKNSLPLTLSQSNDNVTTSHDSHNTPAIPDDEKDIPHLRNRLRHELLELAKSDNQSCHIPSIIFQSSAYKTLTELISEDRVLNENSRLWKDLEAIILQTSPNFKTNLHTLTGGKLTQSDFNTAMLIKCGITPSQMMILLKRTKGAISSRRSTLCIKIFDENLGNKTIDSIIRLL